MSLNGDLALIIVGLAQMIVGSISTSTGIRNHLGFDPWVLVHTILGRIAAAWIRQISDCIDINICKTVLDFEKLGVTCKGFL